MAILKVVLCLLVVSINAKIPDYIHRCSKNDPAANTCIINAINDLRPYLKRGISNLDIPPLEPFKLQPLKLNIGTRGTNVTNINVWGASDYKILEVRANLNTNEFKYRVVIPKLRLEGLYEIDAKLLVLVIQGKGPIKVNIKNYKFNCTMKGHKTKINSVTHLKFEKMQCDIGFDGAFINLENLFNGNQLLGNATNAAINDNVDLFFNEIKPKLEDEITSIFTDVANKITLRFPYDELFL